MDRSLMLPKAAPQDFLGRFREIVSDPLNLLIERHPLAGGLDGDDVYLHNGHRVPVRGKLAYYARFSEILIINRGVHEPLEEYVFQEVLKRLPEAPTMIELGAYWGHYSMWFKQVRPQGAVHLVEPEANNLEAGRANFARNGYEGSFELARVGHGHFSVDDHMARTSARHLTILHSDIQGAETEMVEGAEATLSRHRCDYVFVSTHSQSGHAQVADGLRNHGYRIEAAADFDNETTSCDGFLFAASPAVPPVFEDFRPLTRIDLAHAPLSVVLAQTNALSGRDR